MSNSSLVNFTRLSPNYSGRGGRRIEKITPHHMAGNLTVEQCGGVFASSARQASSNYGIGSDGRIGLYVDEANAAWTSSSYANDSRAVTIEVANSSVGGDWPISDAAWNSLINLCVDICNRNGIKQVSWDGSKNGSLTCHYMFSATACPGPTIKSQMAQLANEINSRLGGATQAAPAPTNQSSVADTDGDYHVWLQARTGIGVLPAVKDCEDNAGDDNPIHYLSCWATPGTITARSCSKANGWLPPLTNPSDIINTNTGSVGDGSDMTKLQLYYNSPHGDKAVKYRVKTVGSGWLPWMIDHTDTGGSGDDFAGDGSSILRVEACIVNV